MIQEVSRDEELLETKYDFSEAYKKKVKAKKVSSKGFGMKIPSKPKGWGASRGFQDYFGRWD